MRGPKVATYQPDFRVVLHKTISRSKTTSGAPVSQRFKDTRRVIDLTGFLGEAGGIRTSKNIREPAGAFTIILADAPDKSDAGFESLYGLIEPMDMVEIRIRHGAGKRGGNLPVVMRGFITRVRRSEVMTSSGVPSRAITISGHDYGKLWQMLQILYLPGYIVGADYLSDFRLFEKFGGGLQTGELTKEFMKKVFDLILNPYLDKLMPSTSTMPREVKMDIAVKRGTTSLTGSQNATGTLFSILATYCDVGIWNELFMEDRDDGVYLVFRPNPARAVGVDGKSAVIDTDAPDLPVLDISANDIDQLNLERSDQNVANYYWVRAPRWDMITDVYRKQYAIRDDDKTVLLKDYPNSNEGLYGIRLMEVETQTGGEGLVNYTSGQNEQQQGERDTSINDWINDRRRLLVEWNKDNVVLEEGNARIIGNEQVRAGTFVRLHRGSIAYEVYVVQVDHDYTPFIGYFTTLTVVRGMGFVERAKREGGPDSPYLAETRETRLSTPGAS